MHLPAMWETWVQFLSRKDTLEKEMPTQSNILSLRIPWTEEAWSATVHGIVIVRHDLALSYLLDSV